MIIDFRITHSTMDCSRLLSEEWREYYFTLINDVVDQLSKRLELPVDCTIIIPDDFEKEIKEFQTQNNLVVGFTNNDMGTAQAKVLDYKEEGVLKYVIFINKALVLTLQSDNVIENAGELKEEFIKFRRLAINTIHHELIHVHDDYLAKVHYETICNCNNDGKLIKLMRNLAIVVWREYFACRLSSSTYTLEFMSEIDNFIEQIENLKVIIEEEIEKYRLHGDITIIDREMQTRVTILLNYAAYLLGHLAILGDLSKQLEVVKNIQKAIQEDFFTDIWIDMFYELNELFDSYLKWGINDFDRLSNTVLRCWNNLGIFPREEEDGLYYSIPL